MWQNQLDIIMTKDISFMYMYIRMYMYINIINNTKVLFFRVMSRGEAKGTRLERKQ